MNTYSLNFVPYGLVTQAESLTALICLLQQLFRNQNTAVNPAQQIQLLQQQQYQHLAATQQQQQLAGLAPAPGATFAPAAPYIINPQEPYVIAAGQNQQLLSS